MKSPSHRLFRHPQVCPGFLGGTLAQTGDLKDQKKRLWLAVPAALLGGLTGGFLLLRTSEKLFSNLVPFLILLAASLLALQTPLRTWLAWGSIAAGVLAICSAKVSPRPTAS